MNEFYDFIRKEREKLMSLDELNLLKLYGYTAVDDDYEGFFNEIIDDLETFYDVCKYPAVEIAVSLLKDYRATSCDHFPSKTTLHFLKTWRSKK